MGYHLVAHRRARCVPAPLPRHGCLEPQNRRRADRGGELGRDRHRAHYPGLSRWQCQSSGCGAALVQWRTHARQHDDLHTAVAGVISSFSRPHVSDDNPYSDALFRTLKHTPADPRTPFPTAPLQSIGWSASSTGTTSNIATAWSAKPRPMSAKGAANTTCLSAATGFTSRRAIQIQSDGAVEPETGSGGFGGSTLRGLR